MKKTTQLQFTPEQELLLWSIRVDYTKDQRIANILSKKVDWNYVRETAIQHGIIPLLYKRLKEEMSDFVPSHELLELRTLFMANAVQNLRMTQQLIRVLDLLADAGIEAMPFKGPASAVQAYGDLSMRSFCDLDILIHEKDFDRMYCTFVDHGISPDQHMNVRAEKKFMFFQKKHLRFSFEDIHLEMHWKISENYLVIPLDGGKIWDRNKSISLNNMKIKTFEPEDALILLCLHGSLHMWQELKWLSDLSYMIKNHPNMNWELILFRTEKIGIKRILIIGLFLAQEFGGIIIPSEIKKVIKTDVNSHNLIDKISNNFFLQENHIINRPIYYLKSRERIRDQVNYGLRYLSKEILIPNEYDFNFISLPPIFFPLYLFIRPFRLFIENFIPLEKFHLQS